MERDLGLYLGKVSFTVKPELKQKLETETKSETDQTEQQAVKMIMGKGNHKFLVRLDKDTGDVI